MAEQFTFTTAAHVPFDAIVRAIQLTYPNDPATLESYSDDTTPHNINLVRSLIALDEAGQVAGLAMLGVRGERGWCGDAAVIPPYQNQKLGQALMRRLSDSARSIGLRTLQLEVRADNAPARRVYEKEGYAYSRHMPCYAAMVEQLGWRALPMPADVSVKHDSPDSVLRWYDTRYAATPCWERELSSLLSYTHQRAHDGAELPDDSAAPDRAEAGVNASRARYDFTQSDSCWVLLARVDDAPAGYALVVRIPKSDARVGFLCVDELYVLTLYRRMGVASALLQHIETMARELGLAGVRLLVRLGNDAARQLYRRAGFSENETIFCEKRIS